MRISLSPILGFSRNCNFLYMIEGFLGKKFFDSANT